MTTSHVLQGAAVAVVLVVFGLGLGLLLDGGTSEDGRSSSPVSQAALISAPKSFDGQPTSPQPFSTSPEFADWDVQVHSRDVGTWDTLEGQNAQHGPGCEGPPASHFNNSYEGAVFICNNHAMTAINAGGYGVIYLTPNKLVNFCGAPGVVTWDMSTEIMSKRDWPDVWISPWSGHLAAPFSSGEVDLQGGPLTTMHMDMNNSEYAPVPHVMRDGSTLASRAGWQGTPLQTGIIAGTNQAAVRQTFKITVTRTSFRFERLASNTASGLVYFDVSHADVGFCEGVVQFGHHSYNPQKDNSGVPATWHWDNVDVSPATLFTIVHTNKRFLTPSDATIHFNAPAPANAFLRFTGIGKIKVDGQSVSPVTATQQGQHVEHFSSYFVPIAAGKTSVTLSFAQDVWYTGPYRAKDITVWSKDQSALPTPTFTATPAPVTNTPTATRTPTIPPSSTLTPTPAPPTATPSPTATPEPVEGQCIPYLYNGGSHWERLDNGDVLEMWWLAPSGEWVLRSTQQLPDNYAATQTRCQ